MCNNNNNGSDKKLRSMILIPMTNTNVLIVSGSNAQHDTLDMVALQLVINLVVQGSYGCSWQCPYRSLYAACLSCVCSRINSRQMLTCYTQACLQPCSHEMARAFA